MEIKKLKIMHIEDDVIERKLVHRYLDFQDVFQFELTQSYTLREGMTGLYQDVYDIILMDLGLPDGYGEESFVQIHSHFPQIPLIVLSGNEDLTIAVDLIHKGAQDYLIKDQVNSHSLVRSVLFALARKKADA